MESHRNALVALSLSVIALSAVTIFQSINKESVLGTTTAFPPKPTQTAIAPLPASIPCVDFTQLSNSYCGPETLNDENSKLLSGICSDINTYTQTYCSTTSGTDTGSVDRTTPPVPGTACTNGQPQVTPGEACTKQGKTGFAPGSYVCPDGTTGTLKLAGDCGTIQIMKIQSMSKCQGHMLCPKVATGKGGKLCQKDSDCKGEGESCKKPQGSKVGLCKASSTGTTSNSGTANPGTPSTPSTKPGKVCTTDSKCAVTEYCKISKTVGTYKIGQCTPKEILPSLVPTIPTDN